MPVAPLAEPVTPSAPAVESAPRATPTSAPVASPPASATPAEGQPAAQPAGPTVEAAEASARAERKRDDDPMGEYTVGVMLGVAHVASGKLNNPAYRSDIATLPQAVRTRLASAGLIGDTAGCGLDDRKCRTEPRRGFHLSVPVQIGSTVTGFRFEPFITFADDAKAYGLYTGPTFDFHVYDPLYLGFGLGLKAAWIKADGWKYAGDIYGRIPMHAIWYVHDNIGLVAEFGFGAGASLYVSEVKSVRIDNRTYKNKAFTGGFGRTWDLSFGVRFP